MFFAKGLLEALQQDIYLIFPQISLILIATIMLWPCNMLVTKQDKKYIWTYVTITVLITAGILVYNTPTSSGFSNMLKANTEIRSFQYLIILSGITVTVLSGLQLQSKALQSVEYYALMLFSIAGMLFLVGSVDLISIYFSMELMSLSIYVLAAYFKTQERSIEAGVKYFLMGAFSSSIMLFGISLLFATSGGISTNLIELNEQFALSTTSNELLITVGIIMILAGLSFKIAAAPFHMWSPDVYDGAPTSVTAFIATAPKIASIAAFLHIFGIGLYGVNNIWTNLITIIAIFSMIIGNIAALRQQTMKRLLAYSGIAHIGYILLGVMQAHTNIGVQSVWLYMFTYLMMQVGIFAIVIFMQNKNEGERIDDFRGLSKTHPMLAFAMMIFLLSMAGIPPLLGFLSKFYIFKLAIEHGNVFITVIALLTSALSAYFYLNIIALMYFKDPISPKYNYAENKKPIDISTTILVSISCLCMLIGICFSSYIMHWLTTIN